MSLKSPSKFAMQESSFEDRASATDSPSEDFSSELDLDFDLADTSSENDYISIGRLNTFSNRSPKSKSKSKLAVRTSSFSQTGPKADFTTDNSQTTPQDLASQTVSTPSWKSHFETIDEMYSSNEAISTPSIDHVSQFDSWNQDSENTQPLPLSQAPNQTIKVRECVVPRNVTEFVSAIPYYSADECVVDSHEHEETPFENSLPNILSLINNMFDEPIPADEFDTFNASCLNPSLVDFELSVCETTEDKQSCNAPHDVSKFDSFSSSECEPTILDAINPFAFETSMSSSQYVSQDVDTCNFINVDAFASGIY